MPRAGICTAGSVVAFISAFAAMMPFSCSNHATTAYVSVSESEPGALWGIARRT